MGSFICYCKACSHFQKGTYLIENLVFQRQIPLGFENLKFVFTTNDKNKSFGKIESFDETNNFADYAK